MSKKQADQPEPIPQAEPDIRTIQAGETGLSLNVYLTASALVSGMLIDPPAIVIADAGDETTCIVYPSEIRHLVEAPTEAGVLLANWNDRGV